MNPIHHLKSRYDSSKQTVRLVRIGLLLRPRSVIPAVVLNGYVKRRPRRTPGISQSVFLMRKLRVVLLKRQMPHRRLHLRLQHVPRVSMKRRRQPPPRLAALERPRHLQKREHRVRDQRRRRHFDDERPLRPLAFEIGHGRGEEQVELDAVMGSGAGVSAGVVEVGAVAGVQEAAGCRLELPGGGEGGRIGLHEFSGGERALDAADLDVQFLDPLGEEQLLRLADLGLVLALLMQPVCLGFLLREFSGFGPRVSGIGIHVVLCGKFRCHDGRDLAATKIRYRSECGSST
mmetsp:Transcript_4604/g.8966  ORF Transcript_4604/g.8966 Transcript_4604/m.8966 type:complete len:289 (+) Transcript_4604:456-1322(+)